MDVQKFENLRKWSEDQWLYSNLGDKRRNTRAVKLGINLMTNPKASLSKQTHSWGDLKAAYRLFKEKDITYEKLQTPHRKNTIKEASSVNDKNVVLFIQDTSEIDYSSLKETKNLGSIGDNRGKGYMLHSCLSVIPYNNPEILGIAMQTAWTRNEKIYSGNETRIQRRKRKTEGDIWKTTIENIGLAPSLEKSPYWVSVGDRGNDIFDFFLASKSLNWHYLVRLCQNRKIEIKENKYLKCFIREQSSKTTKTIEMRGRNGKPKRIIETKVTWDQVTILPPKIDKHKKLSSVKGWVIRVWNDEENLEWILFSSLPIEDNESALEKIDWYSKRWLIEEYHKCLKTGCNIEKSQLKTFESLLSLLGFLAIIALRLLQIRTLSRLPNKYLAKDKVPQLMLKILCRKFNLSVEKLTIKDFWIKLARLGGFLGRKSDGDPGWQTLWTGWIQLQTMTDGAYLINNKCG
jgi:hypothetical protein